MKNLLKTIFFILGFLCVLGAFKNIFGLIYYLLECSNSFCKEFGIILIYILSFISTCFTIYGLDKLHGEKRKIGILIILIFCIVINILFQY